MKLLVETTGPFQIHSALEEQWVRHNRPSVVKNTNFIQVQIANEQLTVLSELPDDASDAEFEGYWAEAEGDRELAIDSYKSKFEPVAEGAEGEAPKRTRKKVDAE